MRGGANIISRFSFHSSSRRLSFVFAIFAVRAGTRPRLAGHEPDLPVRGLRELEVLPQGRGLAAAPELLSVARLLLRADLLPSGYSKVQLTGLVDSKDPAKISNWFCRSQAILIASDTAENGPEFGCLLYTSPSPRD